MKISHLHPEHPTETVIQIEGLRQSVTLMHELLHSISFLSFVLTRDIVTRILLAEYKRLNKTSYNQRVLTSQL